MNENILDKATRPQAPSCSFCINYTHPQKQETNSFQIRAAQQYLPCLQHPPTYCFRCPPVCCSLSKSVSQSLHSVCAAPGTICFTKRNKHATIGAPQKIEGMVVLILLLVLRAVDDGTIVTVRTTVIFHTKYNTGIIHHVPPGS